MTIALDNCIALVTGATGGIGREIVKAMKAAGATVIATDLGDYGDHGGADHYFRHDVTSENDWDDIAAFISETYERLDVLVNNAGISIVTKIEETPLSEWHRVNAVNVDSVVIGVQCLLPLLQDGGKARKGGASVINFSSVGGLRGAAFNAAYCTSKAAVKMLSKCMGAEFAALGYNIRVNSVHPGGIETPMLSSIMERYVALGAVPDVATAVAGTVARHPIGRMGRPDEMAGGVVFLASEASSFMTCDELVMDGGFSQV
ncbi:SDR family NAD(P)-dependent oxidoreductase [Croceicoccus bisphenolivorans]|uniref:SDR family NAD(P)-dependent oxidoreductase n=1 Tax=Croceicoccus bisphenolivorans TaxID=1783232 RepID=UPI00082EA626|nr:SDR family oxidoreductase [Croceicoccus bisphenolivorans]